MGAVSFGNGKPPTHNDLARRELPRAGTSPVADPNETPDSKRVYTAQPPRSQAWVWRGRQRAFSHCDSITKVWKPSI